MPHLNDDLLNDIRINAPINCLIVRNKLNEIHYFNENFFNDDFLQLSLKNSIIKKSSQYFISEHLNALKIPFILGIDKTCQINNEINQNILAPDHLLNDERLLYSLINDLKINEYGSLIRKIDKSKDEGFKTNKECGFKFEK